VSSHVFRPLFASTTPMRTLGFESPTSGYGMLSYCGCQPDRSESWVTGSARSSTCQKAMWRLSGDQLHACAIPNSSSYTQSKCPLNTCSVPSVVSRRSVCVAMSVTYMSPPRSKPSCMLWSASE